MSEEIEAVRCGELDDAAHDREGRPACEMWTSAGLDTSTSTEIEEWSMARRGFSGKLKFGPLTRVCTPALDTM